MEMNVNIRANPNFWKNFTSYVERQTEIIQSSNLPTLMKIEKINNLEQNINVLPEKNKRKKREILDIFKDETCDMTKKLDEIYKGKFDHDYNKTKMVIVSDVSTKKMNGIWFLNNEEWIAKEKKRKELELKLKLEMEELERRKKLVYPYKYKYDGNIDLIEKCFEKIRFK